ncbi:MAG TPA: c-type cytochrome, partial [Pirellulaceae bacterium]|nr:c-type cytochrome [Pirellulaceae bacterium]
MLTPQAHVVLISAIALAVASADAEPIDFARDIAPLFREHCIRCHNDTDRSGELSLSDANDLTELESVVPGKPAESALLDAITAIGGERPAMPKEGISLSPEQIDAVRKWIAEGAEWPDRI